MKTITIRGIEADTAEKLKSKATKEGKSVNQLTLELLKAGLGLKKTKHYSREYDDLDDLFGQWSAAEYKKIQAKLDQARTIDPDLWP